MDALINAVDNTDYSELEEFLNMRERTKPKIKDKDLKKMVNITKHKLYRRGVMSFGFKL